MVRTEQESDSRRREIVDLLVLPRPTKSLLNGAGFSRETGAYWACLKERSGLDATERAVGKYARAAFDKSERNRDVCPEHQIVRRERVKVSESCTLAKGREIRARAWREIDGLYSEGTQIPRRKGRAS